MLIIDAHLHLDEKVDGTALGAAHELDRQLEQAGVARAIALHPDFQPWSAEEFAEAVATSTRIKAFVNLHPDCPDVVSRLRYAMENLGYIAGLKVKLIQGPYALNVRKKCDYEVYTNPENLPRLFLDCDWAITNGGGSLFEGLCLEKAVHVLPQTKKEERIAKNISQKGGVLGVGIESLREYSAHEIRKVAIKAGSIIDGVGAERISKIIRSIIKKMKSNTKFTQHLLEMTMSRRVQ